MLHALSYFRKQLVVVVVIVIVVVVVGVGVVVVTGFIGCVLLPVSHLTLMLTVMMMLTMMVMRVMVARGAVVLDKQLGHRSQ